MRTRRGVLEELGVVVVEEVLGDVEVEVEEVEKLEFEGVEFRDRDASDHGVVSVVVEEVVGELASNDETARREKVGSVSIFPSLLTQRNRSRKKRRDERKKGV